jgi:hypothetical protein
MSTAYDRFLLAGLGIEDTTADPARPIHGDDEDVARIRAAAHAAKGRIVLTGRTDNFLHGRNDLDDTIRRLTAFADAGADVLYAPGLPDMEAIRAVVRAVAPEPVNVLIGPRSGVVPFAELFAAGVKRISLGAALYRHAMTAAVAGAPRAMPRSSAAPSRPRPSPRSSTGRRNEPPDPRPRDLIAAPFAASPGLSALVAHDDHAMLRRGFAPCDPLHRWCRDRQEERHGWPPKA